MADKPMPISGTEAKADDQKEPQPTQEHSENINNATPTENKNEQEVAKTEENKEEKKEETNVVPKPEEVALVQEPIPDKIKGLKETLYELLKNTKDNLGKDLYNHLKKILVHVALTDPMTALDKFEEISYELRTKNKIEMPERFLNYYQLSESSQAWIEKLRERYFPVIHINQQQIRKAEGGEPGTEPVEPSALGHIPDLLNDCRILEWAGLGFGEELSYLLMKSLKVISKSSQALAVKQSPRTVHFWGLIYGSDKDYYIAEGEKEGGEPTPEAEARGTGVNKYVYWVTDSVTGEWVELPDAVPSTINLARGLKRIFTGDVEAEVIANPHFGKKEKDLLRAQIARIVQMTSLVPKGYYKKQEENERDIIEVPEEEKKLPTFEQLTHLENWCHFAPNILKTGRTTHLQPEPPKEEPPGYDPAAAMKELEAKDPYEPRLKPLSGDSSNISLNYVATADWKVPWTIQIIGDTQKYKEEYKDGVFTNSIIMIKSYIWPGAHIFYQNNRWFNFYVGYGTKADQKEYYPIAPPIPRTEPVENTEFTEPNPKEGDEIANAEGANINPQEIIAKIEEMLNTPEKFEPFLTAVFESVDANHSGKIEKGELNKFLKEISHTLNIPLEPNSKAADEFLKAFDKNGDEKISIEELAMPLKALMTMWIELIKEEIKENEKEIAKEIVKENVKEEAPEEEQ